MCFIVRLGNLYSQPPFWYVFYFCYVLKEVVCLYLKLNVYMRRTFSFSKCVDRLMQYVSLLVNEFKGVGTAWASIWNWDLYISKKEIFTIQQRCYRLNTNIWTITIRKQTNSYTGFRQKFVGKSNFRRKKSSVHSSKNILSKFHRTV